MDILLDFIPKLLLVVIGTGVFGYLNYLRTRRDTLRHQSIEFIDEISTIINKPLSLLFREIRSQKTELEPETSNAIDELFLNRLSVKIKSETYLQNSDFYRFYFMLNHEFDDMRSLLSQVNDNNTTQIANQVRSDYPSFVTFGRENSRTLDIQRFQENELILSFYQFETAQTHILKVFQDLAILFYRQSDKRGLYKSAKRRER
ncbi:MAG: hypothetical protein AAGG51_15550 [Cyanobacteria bacterium P01_G01_bin.54]